MESLAMAVAIIVSPAMFGGPIALLITLWKPNKMSKFRRLLVYLFGSLSTAIGIFLILENVSPGARNVGILGIVTGIIAIYRVRRFASGN